MSLRGEPLGASARTRHVKAWDRLRPEARQRLWRWVRLGGGAAILAVLVLRLGTGPFVDGLRRVDIASLAAVIGLTAMTTFVSAWRWRLIARGLGLHIPLGRAIASYYRSQFLNSTLPGGVLGDFHRGVRHGEEADDVSAGLRSVVWDRASGQLVQVVLAVATLVALTSPVRPALAAVAGAMAAAAAIVALVVVAISDRGRSWPRKVARLVRADVRAALVTKRAWPAVFIASAVVVAGHVGVFLVAARADGSNASIRTLLPLAMLVLLAMTVPTSIGGWGPREGVAAWAFSIAGLGADQGVATATVYGVLSLAATLPGAVVLVVARRRRRPTPTAAPPVEPAGRLVGSTSAAGSGGRSDG
jgi:glycosyltransferase 2 family protein